MAIVGAGVVGAVSMPFGAMTDSRTDHTWQSSVAPDSHKKYDMPVAPAGTASVRFSWNSTRPAEVWWFAAGPCSDPPSNASAWCLDGSAIVNWTGSTSGHWTASGPPATGYCVLVDDDGSVSVNFTGEFVEAVPDPGHRLPMVPLALALSGGSMLVGIGALAVYLGVFLPSGVYRPKGPRPSAEDSPEFDEGDAPLDPDGPSEPPA